MGDISCLSQIRWISVWCRAFEVNFGDLLFPVREELLSVASSSGPGAATSAATSPLACAHKGETHELGSQFYEDGACERSVWYPSLFAGDISTSSILFYSNSGCT